MIELEASTSLICLRRFGLMHRLLVVAILLQTGCSQPKSIVTKDRKAPQKIEPKDDHANAERPSNRAPIDASGASGDVDHRGDTDAIIQHQNHTTENNAATGDATQASMRALPNSGFGPARLLASFENQGYRTDDYKMTQNASGHGLVVGRATNKTDVSDTFIFAMTTKNGKNWQQILSLDHWMRDHNIEYRSAAAKLQRRREEGHSPWRGIQNFDVVVGEDGRALVAWSLPSESPYADSNIFGAFYSFADSQWESSLLLSSRGGQDFSLAYDEAARKFWLSFATNDGPGTSVKAFVRNISTSLTNEPMVDKELAADPGVQYLRPKLVFRDGFGVFLVKRLDFDSQAVAKYKLVTRFVRSGEFGPLVDVGTEESMGLSHQLEGEFGFAPVDYAVAISRKHEVIITWDVVHPKIDGETEDLSRVFMSKFGSKGDLISSKVISPDATFALSPMLAANEDGQVVVAWQERSGLEARARYQSFITDFVSSETDPKEYLALSPSTDAYQYAGTLRSLPDGRFAIAYTEPSDEDLVYRIVLKLLDSTEGSWAPGLQVSSDEASFDANRPHVYLTSEGELSVLWRQLTSDEPEMHQIWGSVAVLGLVTK